MAAGFVRPVLAKAAVLSFFVAVLPRPAAAALGGNAASVDNDRVRMQGALMGIVRTDTHAVHEIRAASGTTVREYLTSTGTVFAVAWQGPWLPDMRQVLGSHFDQYQRAMQTGGRARKTRGSIAINESDLVVQMTGHQRSFSGRAYVPALVPAGMRMESIK